MFASQILGGGGGGGGHVPHSPPPLWFLHLVLAKIAFQIIPWHPLNLVDHYILLCIAWLTDQQYLVAYGHWCGVVFTNCHGTIIMQDMRSTRLASPPISSVHVIVRICHCLASLYIRVSHH